MGLKWTKTSTFASPNWSLSKVPLSPSPGIGSASGAWLSFGCPAGADNGSRGIIEVPI